MSCQFKEKCPSYSGWCESPNQDFSNCVEFIINAYNRIKNEQPKILFECDRRNCDQCKKADCYHTVNIRHAKNFELVNSIFVEVRN